MSEANKSVLVITSDEKVSEAVGTALSGMKGYDIRNEKISLSQVNGRATALAAGKDLIIFETGSDEAADLEAVRAFAAARHPGSLLFALADSEITLSRVRALNAAGVDDVLPTTDATIELPERVKRLGEATSRSGRPGRSGGRVIAVAQARGGIGSTTVAVNLAIELAQRRGRLARRAWHSVALVDLDLQFGSIGSFLDLGEQDGLHRLAMEGTLPDATFLAQAMTHLPSGLNVLAAPGKFIPFDALRGDQVTAMLNALQRENDYVILDLPRVLVDWIEPVLKRTDELILVTDTSVPAIRNSRRLIDFFTADNPSLRIEVVVDRERRGLFDTAVQKDASQALERKLRHWLPYDAKTARAAVDRGKPLAQIAPWSGLARSIRRLAHATAEEFPVHGTEARRAG